MFLNMPGTSYLEVIPKIRSFTDSPLERLLPISHMDLTLDSILGLSKRIFTSFLFAAKKH
jgi:hypothetical protein